jgi:hypothetical protein
LAWKGIWGWGIAISLKILAFSVLLVFILSGQRFSQVGEMIAKLGGSKALGTLENTEKP